MTDPVNPTPVPPANPAPAPGANTTTTTGLPPNVAAALACIPLIGGLVFYILEKHDQFVRFYAMQSIIFGGIWFLFNLASWILHLILVVIPVVGWAMAGLWVFVSALVHLGLFVVMIIAMVKAFSGVRWDIPYIGPIARKQVGEA
ncbi:MAG TPA: DUF4870 domain-containing protein [Chthoniobacterales bacterium]|jgi:uncharacterized membrane protein|nr:DUF4870 domain-containing protein [Chthoniobacterales bacterium]